MPGGFMIKLYCGKLSIPGLKGHVRDIRPTWLLEELAVPYERIALDVMTRAHKTPEYLNLHPQGKIPALEDGDFSLFESAAIVNYIAEKFSLGKLIPAYGSQERALHDQWMFFAMATLEPFAVRIRGAIAFGEGPADVSKAVQEHGGRLGDALSVLERHFSMNNFILGPKFMSTDVVLAKAVDLGNAPEIMNRFPSVQDYLNRCFGRPAYIKAHALNCG
jgi:glutathione S-transferase